MKGLNLTFQVSVIFKMSNTLKGERKGYFSGVGILHSHPLDSPTTHRVHPQGCHSGPRTEGHCSPYVLTSHIESLL